MVSSHFYDGFNVILIHLGSAGFATCGENSTRCNDLEEISAIIDRDFGFIGELLGCSGYTVLRFGGYFFSGYLGER